MTKEENSFICLKAAEIAAELWGSEHLQCRGNLEIKMQEIVKNLTKPVVSSSVCKCPYCDTEMKGIELTHYRCKNCNLYFTN